MHTKTLHIPFPEERGGFGLGLPLPMLSCVCVFGYPIFAVAFDNNKITVDNGELFDYYSLHRLFWNVGRW